MKIRKKVMPYEKAIALPRPQRRKPLKPNILFRAVIRIAAIPDLLFTRFSHTRRDMEKAGKGPWLVLMNHSSFIDLEIASKLLFPSPYCIVCTSDGFVGKEWLMRLIGCIPTQKFVSDPGLIGDMDHALHELGASVLMYPEASYSFDGCATPLPRRMGRLLKHLDVPVVTIMTRGAFARDPLYNGLQKRKVKVSAEMKCILSREEIAEKTTEELDAILSEAFTFDNFAWQYENNVHIKEDFRADGLDRILYKCPACGVEGRMEGKGTGLTCRKCGKRYHLNTLGRLEASDGVTEFPHIPDWYDWERRSVLEELENGTYKLDVPVKIGLLTDFRSIKMVGDGHLTHDINGFALTGGDGALNYRQKPLSSYGLYSDYYWYEVGDVICIGNSDTLYYCFPPAGVPVAKARLAAEELYKLRRKKMAKKD